jgi:hypothetical protein
MLESEGRQKSVKNAGNMLESSGRRRDKWGDEAVQGMRMQR